MSLDEFFKKPVILPGTASQRLRRQTIQPSTETVDKEPCGSGGDYALKYIQQEEKLYGRNLDAPQTSNNQHGALSEIDTLTHQTAFTSLEEDDEKLYCRYPCKRRKQNETLPIFREKDKILKSINNRKVVIIKGATGCGKTTQVPQFILNAARDIKQFCNIIVTQPRRIAAISVAKRVADELSVPVGSLVGYQVGLDRKVSEDTRLLYCTTGVLLQKLINQKSMQGFTHVILDEIHERDQDMDFLLLVVRKLLNTNSRDVKVILMSATIDTRIFSEYFFTLVKGDKYPAFPIDISEKRKYSVILSYLDGILNGVPEAHGITLDLENPEIVKKGYLTAVRLIQLFDSLDDAENKSKGSEPNARGSVLVFLPGLHEIEEMESILRSKEKDNYIGQRKQFMWKIIPLHSTITHEEQKSVFLPVQTGYRKIILSTNIAESSITVQDVVYVIDFCLTKTMVTDPITNFCHLKLEWASKNSLEQRAGRVGRVSDGRVYRLITEDFYNDLEQETTPEMLRCPLDRLVLQSKVLDMGKPKAILGLALDRPRLENIKQTILCLKEVGALLLTANRKFSKHDGDLTKMGSVLATLPLDVRSAKLIFIGNLFGVLEDCVIMACSLSVKSVFCQPFREYLKSYNMKLNWADSSCSDCIAFCNAYKLWRKKTTEGAFSRDRNNLFQWARDHFVELRSLKEIAILEKEIQQRLKNCGITRRTQEQHWENKAKKALFIKLAISAAFFPNYFFRGSQGGQVDEKDAVVVLGGHDPFSTVYLQGMPSDQPSVLYKQAIQQKFSQCSNRVNVLVDNSAKVFIQFGRSEEKSFDPRYRLQIPGKISLAVYRAVKMRQQPDFKFRIPVMNPLDANKRYQSYQERCETINTDDRETKCPHKFIPWPWNKDGEDVSELIEVNVSHVETPHHFWIQSKHPNVGTLLLHIVHNLNEPDALEPLGSPLKAGRLCAALFRDSEHEKFYRCRILAVNDEDDTCDIYYVDYGNTQRKYNIRRLRDFGRDLLDIDKIELIPDLAYECSLAKVRPTTGPAGEGEWLPKAITLMENECLNKIHNALAIEVYSVVDNIAVVKLMIPRHPISECFNDLLIYRGLAEKCEESYLSIIDHAQRKRIRKLCDEGSLSLKEEVSRKNHLLASKSAYLEEGLQPENNECSQTVVLRGPFSPLEMKIFGGTQCSVGKSIRIESTSVNSVLLDTNPSDSYERMVVASFVTTNELGNKLILRSTTIMPNLPGLPALVCLMFAPMVELRKNEARTKLTGALCGLGVHPETGHSLFPENDIEIIFDVDFDLDDIREINRIRFWLNKAVCFSNKASDEEAEEEMRNCKDKLIEYISGIFEKRYELQELNFFLKAYQWDQIEADHLLNPCTDSAMSPKCPGGDYDFVYRLIWGIHLDGDPTTEITAVVKNIQQLRDFALGQVNIKSMECILCRVAVSSAVNAKLHLKSSQHKVRQKRFNIPGESVAGSRLNLSEYR
ncbi:hypothetical protein V9T40_013253 [Parthenolecanium corni]|uniref:Probable ATP-dependent RNA helicase spindle-E n=1 Tax=Parthenolecanium corni TaxID=536013 RepID=A0AAN9TYP7_9HEMI